MNGHVPLKALLVAFAALILPQVCCTLLNGQSAFLDKPTISFEAATVKPYDKVGVLPVANGCRGVDSRFPIGMISPLPPQGRCILRGLTLARLIAFATDGRIAEESMIGGPSWVDSDRFEVQAKAADTDSVTDAQLREMLQGLLIERFSLKFHLGVKDVSGYGVELGKGALKLTPSNGNESPAGIVQMPGEVRGQNVSSAEFAKFVSNQLRTPVIDDTGLSGKFNFSFKTTNGTELSLPGDAPAEGPSIFTSLSEQLGLRLVSRRIPIDLLFIDYAQKPKDQP